MASTAYDYSLFEARNSAAAPKLPEPKSPAKKRKSNVIHLNEKQLRRSHRRNAHQLRTMLNLLAVLLVVGAIGAVVYSQVQLTELTDQINTANNALAEERSLEVQLEMMAAAKMNTDDIETYVQQNLGMEKVTQGQTSYISLSQDDAGTVVLPNEEGGFLQGVWQSILSLFS